MWIFNKEKKKKNKIQQNNHWNINLLSLAPNYEIDNLNCYDYIIEKCLTEPRLSSAKAKSPELKELKNRNIAVTGDYGCGKSSIINSFFAKHNNYKFITVSMGLYGNNTKESNDGIADIYSYILKQILYTERPMKLPFSKYKRNDMSGKYFYIPNILIAFSVILYLLLFLKIININNIFILVITGLFVIFDILYLLQKLNIKGISLGLPILPGNVEFTNNKNNEWLNENIEELIHFFLSTDYSIVVFEDLDRREDYPEIIKNLSMINYTINNSIKKKTIQFVYTISDRCFVDPEERTKSFDAIIPIKPFVNDFNSINRLDKLLSNNNVNSFSNYGECLKLSCKYLKNPRLIFDFVNEFSIYYNNDLPDKSKEELYYLILYKISHPKNFYEFIKKENIFAQYYSREFEEFSAKESGMDFSLIPISHKVELLEAYRAKNLSTLNPLDQFEKMLINRNVITRNFDRLFVNRNNMLDKISIDDEIILGKIRNDEDISKDKLSSVDTIFQELDITDFQRDSIINFELIKYANKNNDKYIQQFIDSITEEKLKFIVNNEDKMLIIQKYKNEVGKLWAVASNMNKKDLQSIEVINRLLFYIFKYCDVEYIQTTDTSIIQYLKSTTSYFKVFSERYDEIKDKYQMIEYVVNDDVNISKFYPNILKDAFVTDKLKMSYENIQIISEIFKIGLESPKIISNIKNIKDKEIQNKILEKIDIIIDIYISRLNKINMKDEDLIFLIGDTSLSISNINRIIDKSANKIKLLDDFETVTECYEHIVTTSNYEFSVDNLKSIYNKNKELLITNNSYIIENINLIVRKDFNKEILEYIVNNVLVNLNYSQLISLLDLFEENNMSDYIKVTLTKNSDKIILENYATLLCYDENLKYLLTKGQIINTSYEPIIFRLNSIGLISSYEHRGTYYIVRIKRKYKIH